MDLKPAPGQATQHFCGGRVGCHDRGHREAVLGGQARGHEARADQSHIDPWRQLDGQALSQVVNCSFGRRIGLPARQADKTRYRPEQHKLATLPDQGRAEPRDLERAQKIDLHHRRDLLGVEIGKPPRIIKRRSADNDIEGRVGTQPVARPGQCLWLRQIKRHDLGPTALLRQCSERHLIARRQHKVSPLRAPGPRQCRADPGTGPDDPDAGGGADHIRKIGCNSRGSIA
jgi:hypothetical protein